MTGSAKVTVEDIVRKKKLGEKIVMLTAYDYPLASYVDACGVDIILVGDSVANVVLGLASTRDVDLGVMIHHAQAVSRAVKRALVVGDMPYRVLHGPADGVLPAALRFIREAGCDAVKVEWFDGCLAVVETLVKSGIRVMGHVGLTPQTAEALGGFKVQGKDALAATRIFDQAQQFEARGCFSLVLECIPRELARIITRARQIPTIGIGAGVDCDGQVLVAHDLLGLSDRFQPKFVKPYAALGALIKEGVTRFQEDVRAGLFPDEAHSYHMSNEELKKMEGLGK